jgi:hypothetical protein
MNRFGACSTHSKESRERHVTALAGPCHPEDVPHRAGELGEGTPFAKLAASASCIARFTRFYVAANNGSQARSK